MKHTIRIKRRGPGDLYFEIDRGASHGIAISARFDSICSLERGLAVLIEASLAPESAAIERNANATGIGPSSRRGRVRFAGCLDDGEIRALLSGVVTADVVDERPEGQRRTDLSGRLCELGH